MRWIWVTLFGGDTVFSGSTGFTNVAANNNVRVYFTDSESDTITIGSGSVPSGFTFTKASTYVQLNQVTSSLDFEVTPKYEFFLTASDEHYGSGDDTEAITYLPFRISVVDNISPTVNDQELSSINENTTEIIIKLMIMAAIYEFMYMHKTPVKVVITEYLKVADFFITESQKSYLNAILDKISKVSIFMIRGFRFLSTLWICSR